MKPGREKNVPVVGDDLVAAVETEIVAETVIDVIDENGVSELKNLLMRNIFRQLGVPS